MNRRQFLCAAAAGAFARMSNARAVSFDLVIKGGRVIDPSLGINMMADVAIADGRIAAVEPNITGGADTLDARGRLVVPGLIDIHTHTARDKNDAPICVADGVTAMVDAGSRGADFIDEAVAVAKASPNQLRVLINVSRKGSLPLMTIDLAELAHAQAMAEPFNLPVMIHLGQPDAPLPKILTLLKRGDIVTHMYAPAPHGILDDNGRLLPEVLAARRRGVWFDVGNGTTGHITWEQAERSMKQGFVPHTISTDWTPQGRAGGVIDLPNVMSKFPLLGHVARLMTRSRPSRIPGEPFPDGQAPRTGGPAANSCRGILCG